MTRDAIFSCLCVTENRPAFIPWLLWNFRKQDFGSAELVVVDSSRWGTVSPAEDIRVIRCAEGTRVPVKRNLALEAARGDVVTWFDDDDWQHPRRLSLLAHALGEEHVLAGSAEAWFIDLERLRVKPHRAERGVLFNGAGVRRNALQDLRFDETRERASDTSWLTAVRRKGAGATRLVPAVLSCWVSHRSNLSNPASKHACSRPLGELREVVGKDAWADTDRELSRLRERVRTAS